MFLIRTAFWLGLVVAFIPVDQSQLSEGERNVTPMETVGLAKAMLNDLRGFCERNQSACETGGIVLSQMGLKAREGAKIVYSYLDDNYGSKEESGSTKTTDDILTGSVQAK